MTFTLPPLALSLVLASGLALPAHAQLPPAADTAADSNPAAAEGAETEDTIVVTGKHIDRLAIIGNATVLSGEDLARDLRGQIGDTLVRQPGVSATSFSPGASRPVLRGFQGSRVALLSDGLPSSDASDVSADHAVALDPLTADRIEILRGPAVLLYGSQAIGGAVNLIDRRIPHRRPDGAARVDALAEYGTAADERALGAAFDVPLGGVFVGHADASYRASDDLRIGGAQLAPSLRADLLDQADAADAAGDSETADALRAQAGHRGRLPNSATETLSAGAGLSALFDRGMIGASVGYYDTDYGVPARPGPDAEAVTISLREVKVEGTGEYRPDGGFIDAVRLRLGYTDYRHAELEDGAVGTTILTQGLQSRLELVQQARGRWTGSFGAQFGLRDFDAIGEEAFVPANDSRLYSLFALQELPLGPLTLQLAGRYEHSRIAAPKVDFARGFDTLNGAVGLRYPLPRDGSVGVNLTYAERAPSAQELLADGPHIATQSYERGDPDFTTEKVLGGEIFARIEGGGYHAGISAYVSRFDDYIYQAATGAGIDGLPVFQYVQADATYVGVEAEGSARLARIGAAELIGDVVADATRATLRDGTPVPRIPPLRVRLGLEARTPSFTARVEGERNWAQRRVAPLETPTDGFTLVNALLSWKPIVESDRVTVSLAANNLFDVVARRAASFTKDFVPIAGRDIRLSVRFGL